MSNIVNLADYKASKDLELKQKIVDALYENTWAVIMPPCVLTENGEYLTLRPKHSSNHDGSTTKP